MSTDTLELSPFLARKRPYEPSPEQRAAMDRSKKYLDPLRAKNGTLFADGPNSALGDRVVPFPTRLIRA